MANTSLTKTRPQESQPEPTSQLPIYQPRFDIVESENELTLYGDLPGVEEKHLDVQYENEQLTIQGHVPPRMENVKMLRQEFGIGNYQRVFTIGASIDAEKISAEIHNGVLIVHLPKSESVKPKRIAVKAV